MNNIKYPALVAMCALAMTSRAADFKATQGDWTLEMTESSRQLNISYKDINLFNNVYASATYWLEGSSEAALITSNGVAEMPRITEEAVEDCFGQGKTYSLRFSSNGVALTQSFSLYDGIPYMIVQATVEDESGKKLQSNSITALAIADSSTPLNGASNRMVWVPFDNDGHLKYEVNLMKNNDEIVSHEVGYVFDGDSRRGLIAGSVDHDTWKSGVAIAGTDGFRIEKFECLSGLTNYFTRDVLPHGKVKGEVVASARFFVGLYDDWREGLNDFGEANTKVVPKAVWEGGNPIGWSSWGVQQNYITYDGVLESAMFVKSLYDKGFHTNAGQTVISLDAFSTDNIPAANLYKLGTKVFSDGTYKDGRETKEGTNQILGQYCGPLVAWEWALDSKVQGTGLNGSPDYTVRDIALKVNGKPYVVPSNGGCAVDPTHPGVKANIEFFMKQFASNGTKYIKADFLNNGIIEGDSWYNPEITTGVQAYNYGMRLLYEEAQKYGMYIVESISPIFPYQYAHGRRTCCDRFSEIGESEYVMNAISYGWWTDKLYTVNDPDQLVMCKGGHDARETEGENRARATTGMATGAFIFGDNFSDKVVYTDDKGHEKGSVVGYPEESRRRALSIMGNEEINAYVRNNTGSFMPVYGHKPSSGQSAESVFMRRTDEAMYLAVFNYNKLFASNGSVELERLGLEESDVTGIKELWSGEDVSLTDGAIEYKVAPKDVNVFKLNLTPESGLDEILIGSDGHKLEVKRIAPKTFAIESDASVDEWTAYNLTGMAVASSRGAFEEVDLSDCVAGVYLMKVMFTDGSVRTIKIVNN